MATTNQMGLGNAEFLVADATATWPGSKLLVRASVAGTLVVQLRGGQQVTLDVPVGSSVWDLAVTKWLSAGTTATIAAVTNLSN